jgi:four helix bundle protein
MGNCFCGAESEERMESYKKLTVYQKSGALVLKIYQTSKDFPREEIFGLTSQLRRSAVTIPCNIAEGYRRGHRREYIQFLYIARGSCGELETLLSLSENLGLIDTETFEGLSEEQDEVPRLLYGLIRSLTKPKK